MAEKEERTRMSEKRIENGKEGEPNRQRGFPVEKMLTKMLNFIFFVYNN